jgi:hypothetical protein
MNITLHGADAVTSSDETGIKLQPDAANPQPSVPPDLADRTCRRRTSEANRPGVRGGQDDEDRLPPVFTDDLLRTLMVSLLSTGQETIEQTTDRVSAAIITLRSFDAREPIEAMLAVHVVLAHHAALACYRAAAQENQPPALASRLFSNAANLSRTLTGVLRNLEQRQDRAVRLSGRDPCRGQR